MSELTPEEAKKAADRAAKLEAARKRKSDDDRAAELDAEDREIAAHELMLELEQTTKGKRGEAFEIVNNRVGVFGLRKPDSQAIRNWERTSDEKKVSLEWQIGILRHYILPAERAIPWAQLGAEHPGLVWQTANAFTDLMAVDKGVLEKKR